MSIFYHLASVFTGAVFLFYSCAFNKPILLKKKKKHQETAALHDIGEKCIFHTIDTTHAYIHTYIMIIMPVS